MASRFAAHFVGGLVQGVVPGKDTGLFARDELFKKAVLAIALYRAGMAASIQGAKPVFIYIPAYFGWNQT